MHKTEQATDVGFEDLTENVKESIAHIIEKEGAEIEYDFSGINSMYGMHSHLYSIFYNLIVNSIKFSRPDVRPMVRLQSSKTSNQVMLKFSDNGQGIDLSKMIRISSAFTVTLTMLPKYKGLGCSW